MLLLLLQVDPQGQAVDIWTNFAQYGLQQPTGLLRMDMHKHPLRKDMEEVKGGGGSMTAGHSLGTFGEQVCRGEGVAEQGSARTCGGEGMQPTPSVCCRMTLLPSSPPPLSPCCASR